jgi:hypothetical protein
MKRLLPLHLILILFAFCTSFPLLAQQTHEITLYVDTEKIDMQNLEHTCNFGQDAGISNEDFTLLIQPGDTIIWKGISSTNPEDKVKIHKVIYSSGTNFFDSRTLRDSDGVVTAQVVNGQPEDYLKYDIEFKVERNGRELSDTFPIDPKLRMAHR